MSPTTLPPRAFCSLWVLFLVFTTSQQADVAERKADNVQLALVSREVERYGDMAAAMRAAVDSKIELTPDEQELFSFAYKKIIDQRRIVLDSISELRKEEGRSERYKKMSKLYKIKLRKEQEKICNDVLKLTGTLTKQASNDESRIFALITKGDYLRYRAEVKKGDGRKADGEEAKKEYEAAYEKIKETMPAISLTRMGLALKLSVLYFDILQDGEKAQQVAQEALDAAAAEAKDLHELGKKETKMTKVLKGNIEKYKQHTPPKEASQEPPKEAE